MRHEVVMPQLGLTMTEGSVSAWLKKPGDRIEKGEALFSVETDKVEMEVEATVSGFVAEAITKPKQVVPVGTVIALIVDREEEIMAGDGAETQRYPASPLAKRLAKELGIDLRELTPAKGNRISAEDVQRAAAQPKEHKAEATPAVPPVELQVSTGRAALAERVTASFERAPHFYLGVEIDATLLVDMRSRIAGAAETQGVKITYTDFFLKAIARALSEQPAVNTFWKDGKILGRQSIDIGFAAQTEDLLLVPVIRGVDQLTMAGIARERMAFTRKARAGKLTLAEMDGGSATLSNLGAFGVDWFQAILNPPQSVIIATGRIAKRPVVVNESLVARDTLTVTASIDHRVLDGVAGAKCLGRIKELLENPAILLL